MPKLFHYCNFISDMFLYFLSRESIIMCSSKAWRTENHRVLSEYGFDRVVLFHDAFTPSFELPILVISISYF